MEPGQQVDQVYSRCGIYGPFLSFAAFYELFALWADEEDRMFWRKQRETAGYSCIWPAIRTQDSHRNMRNTTASPTQVRKLSLDVMTGITATHTGLWQISAWMHFGSIGIRGRKKLQKGCRILLCERKRQLGRSFSYRRDKT